MRLPLCLPMALTLAGLCSGTAFAQPAPGASSSAPRERGQTVRLSYSAPPGCPDRRAFMADVLRRIHAAGFATKGSRRAFTVEIAREGDRYVGHLRGARVSDRPNARSFEDADCAEVARSLSLVLALAIDPEAALAPPPRGAPKPAPRPAAHPERKPRPKRKPRPRARSTPLGTEPRPASTHAATLPGPARFDLGALAFVRAGIASKALVGAGVSARVRVPQLGTLGGPGFALQGLAAQTGVVGPQPREAEYRWLAVRALLAPVSVRPSAAIILYPSLLLDLGAITATGRSIAVPETHTGFWASAGVGLDFGVALGRRLWLDALAGVQANMTRDRFVFRRPFLVVHRIPAASLGASLGLSWRL